MGAYDTTFQPAAVAAPGNPQRDFMAALQPHLALLRRFALRLTSNPHDSEDLVQDLLLKLYEHRERLQGIELMQSWLLRVTYHLFIDRCRRNAPYAHNLSLDQLGDPAEPGAEACGAAALIDGEDFPDELVARLQVASAVRSAINRLAEPQRRLLQRHDLEGVSLNELAADYGMPLNTVKSTLTRARLRLREHLQLQLLGPGSSRPRPATRRRAPVWAEASAC
jgi:RNA polymerase sigma-70 factor (ECF subfamily)